MSNDNRIPVGENTEKLTRKIAQEGAGNKEFTREEKLALVADELMAPEEVGLASAQEAKFEVTPEAKPKPDFAHEIFLQGGVVPIELRAEWAYQEMNVILAPADKTKWIADWIKENQGSYAVQIAMRCGNLEAKARRSFTDPILGLAAMLQLAGEQLAAVYEGRECQPTDDKALLKPIADKPSTLSINDAPSKN